MSLIVLIALMLNACDLFQVSLVEYLQEDSAKETPEDPTEEIPEVPSPEEPPTEEPGEEPPPEEPPTEEPGEEPPPEEPPTEEPGEEPPPEEPPPEEPPPEEPPTEEPGEEPPPEEPPPEEPPPEEPKEEYVYVAVNSGDDGKSGSETEPVKTLGKALDIWAARSSAEAKIMLLEDIVQGGYSETGVTTTNGFIDFSSLLSSGSRGSITSLTLSGDGTGKIIDNANASNRRVLYINTALTINLENLTITGGRGDRGAGIHIGNGGVLSIAAGVIIKNNEANTEGGGVYVTGAGSSFTMNGGEISHNKAANGNSGKGGGVYVETNGTFTMEGGTITENESGNDGGGVYVADGSTALIKQGDIKANKAKYGGGVYIRDNGRLELGLFDGTAGPAIELNTARNGNTGTGGGVVINGAGAWAVFYAGRVSQNSTYALGGGILIVNGTLDMRGGTVTGNLVDTTGKGPGIAIESSGRLQMSGLARALETGNPIFLYGASSSNPRITLDTFTGGLSGDIAKLALDTGYAAGIQVLSGNPTYYGKFKVISPSGFTIGSDGKLQ
jgi:hypothetical protein